MTILQKSFVSCLLFFCHYTVPAQADVQLRFDAPATHFTQSLPLGNGRLGAMVFGDPTRERIVLNEKSMWSGGIEDPNRHDAYQYLPAIQQFLKGEKNKKAQELLQQHFTSAGAGSGQGHGAKFKYGSYQILADLFINWTDSSQASEYNRVLDIEKAVATTSWKKNEVRFTEEVFCSAPQQVILIRISANKAKSISFDLQMNRKENASVSSMGNTLTMSGQLEGGNGEKGIYFDAYMKLVCPDGRIYTDGKRLRLRNASECVIIISAATSLNWPTVEKRIPSQLGLAKKYVNAAAKISWTKLIKQHIADFKSYFDRCRLKFIATGEDAISQMTTTKRLLHYAEGKSDPFLPVLYFNYGRYLLISSSRPGGLPANLQGLWAEEYEVPWNGDYHLNINVQMNYWPAEKTNLADCHLPLIDFTEQLVIPGQKTARSYYNSNGWVAHVISNPWKFTAPGEGAQWGSTLTGGAWLCAHLWQHYLYHPNEKYLREIYPVLKGAAQFYTSILIEDPKTGWLVTAPSNSPENSFITEDGFRGQTTMGPTMDMQIGRELLTNVIAAASLLNTDKAWRDSLQGIKERLAPNQVSASTGGIQEWIRDYKETEPQHRHISQLYGLYPYDEINERETPQLVKAAEKTLLRRGDAATGWSRAWKINFWAKLGDGDHAFKMLKALLEPAFTVNGKYEIKGAGSYPNLFCAHPPFQIDGNFGAAAAIAEMLMQSTGKDHVIRFLPALPSSVEWSKGEMKGLCAPYGFVTDFSWDKGKLTKAVIHSVSGYPCNIQLPDGLNVYDATGKKINIETKEGNIVGFKTAKGEKYFLK